MKILEFLRKPVGFCRKTPTEEIDQFSADSAYEIANNKVTEITTGIIENLKALEFINTAEEKIKEAAGCGLFNISITWEIPEEYNNEESKIHIHVCVDAITRYFENKGFDVTREVYMPLPWRNGHVDFDFRWNNVPNRRMVGIISRLKSRL